MQDEMTPDDKQLAIRAKTVSLLLHVSRRPVYHAGKEVSIWERYTFVCAEKPSVAVCAVDGYENARLWLSGFESGMAFYFEGQETLLCKKFGVDPSTIAKPKEDERPWNDDSLDIL